MHQIVRVAHNTLGVIVFSAIVLSTAAVTLSLTPVPAVSGASGIKAAQVAGDTTERVLSNQLPLELTDAHTGQFYQSQLRTNGVGSYAYRVKFAAQPAQAARSAFVKVVNPNSTAQQLRVAVKVPTELATSVAIQVDNQQLYNPSGAGALNTVLTIPANSSSTPNLEFVFVNQINFPFELEFTFSIL